MGFLKTAVQSALMSMTSNVLAQMITCWRTGTPLTLNFVRLFQFVSFSVLACPPNYLWQRFLEAQFPAYAAEVSTGPKKARTEKSIDREAVRPAKQLNIKNTAAKFTLDQTIGAAVNTVLFIAGIALLRGQSLPSAFRDVQEQFWSMIFAGQKLWPAVSILSFTAIPLEQRMLFGSVAGLFWGIYLSLVAGG